MKNHSRVPTVILVLFGINLALGILYIANYYAGQPVSKLNTFLDLNGEHNLPTWYSSIQWFSVAALLGLFAYRHLRPLSLRSWMLAMLPLIFLAMSLDEVAEIHEWVGLKSDALLPGGDREHTVFSYTGIWMFLLGVPFFVIFSLMVYSLRHYFLATRGALYKMFFGVVIMLAGALGVETISNFVTLDESVGVFTILSEELFEMFGATVVLWGAYELLDRHGFSIVQKKSLADSPS